jgi:hypothetical protein
MHKMTKRRLIALVALASALLVLGGYVVVRDFTTLDEAPGVTEANYNRIKEGMTLANVQGLLGSEGEEFVAIANTVGKTALLDDSDKRVFEWIGEGRCIVIVTFLDGEVSEKEWHASNRSALEKLRRWLGLW